MRDNTKTALIVGAFAIAGIAYLIWLDHGCDLAGAMTWHGKICL